MKRETEKLLTACGVAGAEEMRERVLAEIPDAVPNLIRPLLEAGLIQGWRNVAAVNLPRELPDAVHGPFMTGYECCAK